MRLDTFRLAIIPGLFAIPPTVLADAGDTDAMFAVGGGHGPLHCFPMWS